MNYGSAITIDKSELTVDDALLQAHVEGRAERLAEAGRAAFEAAVRAVLAQPLESRIIKP